MCSITPKCGGVYFEKSLDPEIYLAAPLPSHLHDLHRPEAETPQVDDERDRLEHLVVDLGLHGQELVVQL